MSRFVLAITLLAFAALPAQAQKQKRTFVNSRGLVCTEKTDDRAGKEKYDLKCRASKGKKKHLESRDCINRNRDGRCDFDIGDGRRYPSRLPDVRAGMFDNQGRRRNDFNARLFRNARLVRRSVR